MLQVNRAIPAVRERQKGQPSDYFCPHQVSNPWYTRRRKKGGKAFKKVEQVDGQEKAVYARVQGQSGPGKLSTRYDDRSSAQEAWGLQLHDSSLAAGVSNQSALALR